MKCTCKDWKPNIAIVNSYIVMPSPGAARKDTLENLGNFDFCPWCAEILVEDDVEIPQEEARSFSLIVAMDRDRGIGKDGTLPWRIKEDMAHFKETTMGNGNNVVIMGRKTWDSIPEKYRPLPDRTNVVISRQKGLDVPEEVLCVDSLETALNFYDNDQVEGIFVIGGSQIYAEAVKHSLCKYLIVTHINASHDCDVFFPEFEESFTSRYGIPLIHSGFSFITYINKSFADA